MRSSGDDYSALAGGYDDDDNDDDDADGRADAASDEGLGMVLVNVVPVNELATPRLPSSGASASATPPTMLPGQRVTLFTIAIMSAIDNALMLPSLWPYVQTLRELDDLGPSVQLAYGQAQSSYFISRVVFIAAIAQALDRGWLGYKAVLQLCFGGGALAAALYALALPCASRFRCGVRVALAARAALGASSAVSVAYLSFVASFVPGAKRTPLLASLIGAQRAVTPIGPALVLGLSLVPDLYFRGDVKAFNSASAAGLVVALLNAVSLVVVCCCFTEPERAPALTMPTVLTMLRHLRRTGAWTSFAFSFQNNWTNQTLLWTLPLVTSQLYGESAARDAAIFATGGLVGVATALAVKRAVKSGRKPRDRSIIVASQLASGVLISLFVVLFGCRRAAPSSLFPHKRPLWVLWLVVSAYFGPFVAQMPSNNAIYSKLLETAAGSHQASYQSLLEISKALARALAGYAIGTSYATAGPCALWGLTALIWAAQFLPLLITWDRLGQADDRVSRPPSTRPLFTIQDDQPDDHSRDDDDDDWRYNRLRRQDPQPAQLLRLPLV